MNKLKALLKNILTAPLKLDRYEDLQYGSRKPETRITYWVNGGYRVRAEGDKKLYWWMFGEDMHLRVIPYPRGAAKISLCPSDEVVEHQLKKELDDDRYAFSLQEVVEGFVRTVTQIVYTYGDAYYEIEHLEPKEDGDPRFRLQLIYTPSMKKLFGQYFQVITPGAAKHARIKMGVTRVPKAKLLHISSPPILGGGRVLRKIKRGLLSHGGTPLPDFLLETLEPGSNIGLNIEEYRLNRYIYRARLTRLFGWSQRENTDAPILEYYWLTRTLRQAKAIILIREYILEKLNTALKEFMGDEQKIHIKGPYTLKDIDEAETKLKQGDVNVGELVKKFL